MMSLLRQGGLGQPSAIISRRALSFDSSTHPAHEHTLGSGWPPESIPPPYRSRSEGRLEVSLPPLKEVRLGVSADLAKRYVRVARFGEFVDRDSDRFDGVSAGNGVSDVVRPHVPGGGLERCRTRQLGIDLPSAAEPSEQLQCPLDCSVPVSVVAHW